METTIDTNDSISSALGAFGSNGGILRLRSGTYSTSGLSVPSHVRITGEGWDTIIHVSANAAALDISSKTNIAIDNLVITGTGADYTGYGTGPSDAGQKGIHISNSTNLDIAPLGIFNMSGNAIDYESSPAWTSGWAVTFQDILLKNNWRGIYTHGSGEYAQFSNINARNNVFGAEIASGNINLSNCNWLYNSVGFKLSGGTNVGHSTMQGGSSNHNTYNLTILDQPIGFTFSGVNFIGGQAGGLATDGSHMIGIYNSRQIIINGGQLGSLAYITQANPSTSDTSMAGPNMICGMSVRDDLSGWAAPNVNYTGGMVAKNNLGQSGLVSWNN